MCVYSKNVFFSLSPFILGVSATFPLTMTCDYLSCLASRAVIDVCPLVNFLDYFYQKLRGGQALQARLGALCPLLWKGSQREQRIL